MPDSHLAPFCELPSSPPPQPVGRGPQRVPLEKLVQVFKGTYKAPFGIESPLPPHYWELQRLTGPDLFIRGTRSDKAGVSGIIDGKKLRAADAEEKWYLVLRPDLSNEDLAIVAQTQEVWIDIEKNTWVALPAFPQQEQRKLIRIPLWTSRWKVQSGGFADGPPGSFLIDGTLTTADIRAKFGTSAKPWPIQIDFGWWMTFVQFHYYDHALEMFFAVPPGLAVKALGSKLDVRSLTRRPGRVGGGTCIDDAGTVCVLHERTEDQSADVELAFEHDSGVVSYVELKPIVVPGNQGFRMHQKPAAKVPALPIERYLLPVTWHSLGWEARVGAAPRKAWSDLKPTAISTDPFVSLATSASDPLIFDLDDTVLAHFVGGVAPIPAGARITLFDHKLAFRGPAFDPVVSNWWAGNLAKNYLRAEETIVDDGDAPEASTFVIEHEGDFFVRREKRAGEEATDRFGVTSGIGMRKAVARSPGEPIGDFLGGFPSLGGDGRALLILLPDAYPGPYFSASEGAFLAAHPTAKLCHLLVYVPLKIGPDPSDPLVTPPDVTKIYAALLAAAERWDQAHPAGGAAGKKDYVAIPSAGVKDGTRVVKIRHYFGPRMDGNHKFEIQARRTPTPTLGFRSFVSNGVMRLFTAVPDTTADSQDSDRFALRFSTLAHELGHVMGLPDEYMEMINLASASLSNENPRIPRFSQAHEAYPFYGDNSGLMWFSQLPRLRYMWHHIAFLNGGAAAALPEGPYVASDPSLDGGITHAMPGGNKDGPWSIVAQSRMASKRASMVLYRVGDDESTVEKMFKRPAGITAPGAWINGLLLVTMNIWFNFLPSAAGDFPDDGIRWQVVQTFYRLILAKRYVMQQRFFLEGPASAALSRVAVVFQPRVEFGPLPTSATVESNADVVVDVVFQNILVGPPPPAPPSGAPSPSAPARLRVNMNQVDLSILRFALDGGLTPLTVGDDSPIRADELSELARMLETSLGSPANSFSVKALP
jgi:hypothetical protein